MIEKNIKNESKEKTKEMVNKGRRIMKKRRTKKEGKEGNEKIILNNRKEGKVE